MAHSLSRCHMCIIISLVWNRHWLEDPPIYRETRQDLIGRHRAPWFNSELQSSSSSPTLAIIIPKSARAGHSLIATSCSRGGFHFSPLQGRSHFLLFIPYPCTSFQGSVTPPYSIIELRHSFLGEYTASKHHSGELYENLELDGQPTIDRMKRLKKQMRQYRDRTELKITFSFVKETIYDVHLLGRHQ